jgi:Bacterial Ig-like domain (group 1)
MRRPPTSAHGRRTASAVLLLVLGSMVIALLASSSASANGVALSKGDVLAGAGEGTIKHFDPSGALLDTLNTTSGAAEDTGMCFDGLGNLYSTNFAANTMSEFDSGGNLVAGEFANGFSEHPESCVFNTAGDVYVSEADGTREVRKLDSTGKLLESFAPEVAPRGTDWLDLGSDQCTLHYTSEGNEIKAYNVCTKTQLPAFAKELPASPCYAHRILPDGSELVACTSVAFHVNSSGEVINTYEPKQASGAPPETLFALNLDPDGTTFWTADIFSGEIWRINIETGAVVTQFNAAATVDVAGLAIVGEHVCSEAEIKLTPVHAVNPVGTTHTVVATVTECGKVVEGATVTFKVSGANSAEGTAATNASGEASFTYKGEHAGTDHIVASFVNKKAETETSNEATKIWEGPVCTKVAGTGHWGPRGPEGGNLGDNLTTELSGHEELQTTGPNKEFHIHLTKLESANCGASEGGLEFSGVGKAKFDRKPGYTISFAFRVLTTGQTFYTLIIEKEGALVVALMDQELRRLGTEHIS